MGKKNIIFMIIVLQVVYVLMIIFNGIGQLNVIVENLGLVIWTGIPILSLLLCIWYFYKTKDKYVMVVVAFSLFQIVLSIFFLCLPCFVRIPFD